MISSDRAKSVSSSGGISQELGIKYNRRTGATAPGFVPKTKTEKVVHNVLRKTLEVKFLDTAANYANISAAGTLAQLTTIAQGAGGSQRVGDEVRLQKLILRVAGYQNNTTSVQLPNIVRVIVFRWNEYTNATAPTGTAVLQVASVGSIGQTITSPYCAVYLHSGDLQILHDSWHYTSLNSNSFATKIELDLDSELSFVAAATTGSGHLYLALFSDDVGVVSPCPSVAYNARVQWVDE